MRGRTLLWFDRGGSSQLIGIASLRGGALMAAMVPGVVVGKPAGQLAQRYLPSSPLRFSHFYWKWETVVTVFY